MAKLLLLVVVVASIAGCRQFAGEQPTDLYWNPLTCRCHSSATGDFVDTSKCLKDGVSLSACPTTEADDSATE